MELAPLPLRWRLVANLAAAGLLFLGSPGISGRDGSLVSALLGVALWAWTVAHPLGATPRRARLVDWLGGSVAGALYMWWVVYVVGWGLLYIGAGVGLYTLAMGMLVRRARGRVPLALAVAASWTALEILRARIPPPFGLGWFRLGYHAHAELWLSGAARVLGIEGLTFVVAALGGALAALVLRRRLAWGELAAGLGPFVAAVALARLVPAPPLVDGPRVLLVQPGIPQIVKQHSDAARNFASSLEATHAALAREGPVDLVCWGESMLYLPLFTAEAEAAVRAGAANLPPWEPPLEVRHVEGWQAREADWVRGELYGGKGGSGLGGASFAVGAEVFDRVGDEVRRRVALVLYDGAGNRSAPAFKQHLVPLGETFFGLERLAWIRNLAEAAAGYVPDLVAGSETGRLTLRARDGRFYRLSGTVCFDNAHPYPYRAALRDGPVDFHLVASNEAWYETSCEMDQMIAFSRVLALATGRSFVRATNSGVSAVIGADGVERGRVTGPDGADRAVPGALALAVPVPPPGFEARTPQVRWGAGLELLLVGLGGLVALLPKRSGNRSTQGG